MAVEADVNDGELHYQWSKNTPYVNEYGEESWTSVTLIDKTEPSLESDPVTGRAQYRCVVSDDYGNRRRLFRRNRRQIQ